MSESTTGWGNADAVVLDIGGDVGAVIVHTDADLEGREIELSPADRPAARVHTAIRARRVNGRTHYAATFFAVPDGEHIVWRDHGLPGVRVSVSGGEITTVNWRRDAIR